ncbi:permease [Lacrimispora amygdalina]|uniref:permease n=1 Tax=Lacrimispora amygdalina TaxID=253257 RepID=UPI000BE2541C|nr:permease [Lacrimispora amygdalina]
MRRYRYPLIIILVIGLIAVFDRRSAALAVNNAGMQLRQMFFVLPPIFLLLGLLDVWVPRTTMVKYMGEGSGLKGIFLAFVIGSAAAGPLYGAFPVAAVFMKKGVKFLNLMIFIGAWSTTKIPMLMFEIESLGLKFALTRLVIDIPGIILIAFLLTKLISKREIEEIYENSENMA